MPRKARRSLPVSAPQDQGYGVRGEQMAAQHAIPLPDNRGTGATAGVPQNVPRGTSGPAPDLASILGAAQGMTPATPLDAPSDRPDEPFTAGLPMGAGPGPPLTMRGPAAPELDQLVETLRAAYAIMPTEAIAAMLERLT